MRSYANHPDPTVNKILPHLFNLHYKDNAIIILNKINKNSIIKYAA